MQRLRRSLRFVSILGSFGMFPACDLAQPAPGPPDAKGPDVAAQTPPPETSHTDSVASPPAASHRRGTHLDPVSGAIETDEHALDPADDLTIRTKNTDVKVTEKSASVRTSKSSVRSNDDGRVQVRGEGGAKVDVDATDHKSSGKGRVKVQTNDGAKVEVDPSGAVKIDGRTFPGG